MIAALLLLLAQQYQESITVTRYVMLVRVVDSRGAAVRDLTASDFIATIGDQPAEVESVEWIEGMTPRKPGSEEGRLILFFIHSDFARNTSRVAGQMRFNVLSDEVIEMLGPNDRLAVASYDLHLKLRADFTSDRAAIRKAIRDSLGTARVPLPKPPDSGPSLARHLDEQAMRDAASAEAAMLLAAEALRHVEGEKLIVMASYGLGERRGWRIHVRAEWSAAMALLQQQRVPVITVNTGLGGELAFALAATAKNTSGVYTFVDNFSSQSIRSVTDRLSGSYELVLRMREPLEPGQYAVDVRVGRQGLDVQAPRSVIAGVSDEIETDVLEEDERQDAGSTARRLFTDAMRILQAGETAGVEALLDAAIAADATLADAWYERGMLAAARGDNEAAARDLRRYLELAPKGKHAADAKEVLRSLE